MTDPRGSDVGGHRPSLGTPTATAPARVMRLRGTYADWLGFVFFIGFAIAIFARSREIGLLLVPPVMHEVAMAFSFLVRGRAQRTTSGIMPRIAAYGATFLIPAFIQVALMWVPAWLAVTRVHALRELGGFLWLFGLVLGLWPLWCLRHSFSLEPAARELVTSGPYELARHPIYTTYILTYTGICLIYFSLPFAVVLAAWFALICVRVHYEERVLSIAFPEYAAYRERVGAFGPKLSRVRAAAAD